jgi:cytosine/adenosine deaminase-related metal-dependent hydrolase
MQLNAGVVLFADGSMAHDVTITVKDGLIVDIGPYSGPNGNVSYAAVTPTFHNGHSHCEYELLSGALESTSFFPWVRDVVRIKMRMPKSFWVYSTLLGVNNLMSMGYASTADCSDSGFAGAAMTAFGLNGTSYREVNGLSVNYDLPRCQSSLDSILDARIGNNLGIAPHAIYSTCKAILQHIHDRGASLPICIHVDESPEEDRYCRFGDGDFAEMYDRRGINHPSPLSSAVKYFDSLGLVSGKTLLVHGCNWDKEDVMLVKSRNATVAICPESNHFLKCKLPPLQLLYENAIRTVIGTDSALSCSSMSPMHQLRLLMESSTRADIDRWLFRSQVTPDSGVPYDIEIGKTADFCAFGKGVTMKRGELREIVVQCDGYQPDVFRAGKQQDFQVDKSLTSVLTNIVKELAQA